MFYFYFGLIMLILSAITGSVIGFISSKKEYKKYLQNWSNTQIKKDSYPNKWQVTNDLSNNELLERIFLPNDER